MGSIDGWGDSDRSSDMAKVRSLNPAGHGRARGWPNLKSGLSWVCAIACLVASTTSHADILMGKVVGVSDGDTITVLDAQQHTHKIRLSGIDAPEKAQPFGERAKQQLADWVFQEQVQVIHDKVDRYGRIIGKVTKAGEDVNIQMVHAGLAWHYKAYEREQPVMDRLNYAAAEWGARHQGVGLWAKAQPVAP